MKQTILYFDIDGVLLDYDDNQKPALLDEALQSRLKTLKFDRLVCVSGWSDLVNVGMVKPTVERQKQRIHHMLSDIFPDVDWFMSALTLQYDTDNRCQYIDFNQNWFYTHNLSRCLFQNVHNAFNIKRVSAGMLVTF